MCAALVRFEKSQRKQMKKQKQIPPQEEHHDEGSSILPKRNRSIPNCGSPSKKPSSSVQSHLSNGASLMDQSIQPALVSTSLSASDSIPVEILTQAFLYIDVCDVASICVVSRRWLNAFGLVELILWKTFYSKYHSSTAHIIHNSENEPKKQITCCQGGGPKDEALWWKEQFRRHHLLLRCSKSMPARKLSWNPQSILEADSTIRPISPYLFSLDFVCKSGGESFERDACRHITKLAENIEGPDNEGAFEIDLLDIKEEFYIARHIHGYHVNEVCIHIVHRATGKSSLFYRGEVSDDHYPGYLVYSYFPDEGEGKMHNGDNAEDRSPLISVCIKSQWEDCECQCRCSPLGNSLCTSDCCHCGCEKWGGDYKHERSIEIQMLWDNGEHMNHNETLSFLNSILFD
uniref:F-box domain-containing protein n=1 Tax=Leptocylindrus danicus TaxID=163516 RepID=A0A7S2PSV2_9STRA|mmetsp:Transcript_9641/g.14480  ORF Transcript_9641/g.14480 Transcript_9641/m.14480 type:complete len:403 (+) Transcript_9641:310-1518(+)